MMKTKWLRCSIDASLADISEVLIKAHYYQGRDKGFEIAETLKNCLRGRFVEEFIENEIIFDPFGERIENNIRRYTIFNFVILPLAKQRYLIRIDAPPRSLKGLVSAFSEIFGFGFSITVCEIDIFSLVSELKSCPLVTSCAFKKMKVSGVPLTETSIAKVEVYSSADAYVDLRKTVSLKGVSFEKATVDINKKTENRLEISSSGMICGEMIWIENLMPTLKIFFQKTDK